METRNKDSLHGLKNLKWFRSHVENFNSAVQYQTDSLFTCRNNIRKQYRLENFAAVRQERVNAERTIRHLNQLLVDISQLREQVVEADRDKFDRSVSQSRGRATSALDGFDLFYASLSLVPTNKEPLDSTSQRLEIVGVDDPSQEDEKQKQILIQMNEDQWLLQNQIEVTRGMEKIEKDSRIVNEIFSDLAKIISDQKQTVNEIEETIEESHAQVQAAQSELAQASVKVHGAVYPIVGALIGTCIAGPVGLVAGIKTGIIIAVAATGSVLGFSGGSVLKKRQQRMRAEILDDVKSRESVLS